MSSNEPKFRVLRLIEYVGTREFLDSCISRRVVKGSYHTKNGFIQEAILGDFQELVESLSGIEVVESEPETMHLYHFASVRGEDFEIEGTTAENAWERLQQREKDNGSLWRCMDEHRNKTAVELQGFHILFPGEFSPVYKQII